MEQPGEKSLVQVTRRANYVIKNRLGEAEEAS